MLTKGLEPLSYTILLEGVLAEKRFSRFGAKHHFLCPYKAQNPAFFSFIANTPNIVLSFYIFLTTTGRMSNIFKAKKGFFDSGEGIS